MEDIEYIIVGGPQHGLIGRRPWKADSAMPPVEPACDGLLCKAAARRQGSTGTRYLLGFAGALEMINQAAPAGDRT